MLLGKKVIFNELQKMHSPQYHFLEIEIVKYPILYRDFMNYEKARKLLLYYLTE
ncbi:YxiJ-like family protein [Bacillus wiedmannii]|nr:YxiJ family protein [Bacillus wiedmannii]MBZ4222227.1 YxiJ-like family protein [Bacillus wiedmannii]